MSLGSLHHPLVLCSARLGILDLSGSPTEPLRSIGTNVPAHSDIGFYRRPGIVVGYSEDHLWSPQTQGREGGESGRAADDSCADSRCGAMPLLSGGQMKYSFSGLALALCVLLTAASVSDLISTFSGDCPP